MNETEKADDEVDTYHAWDCSPAELTAEIERLKAEIEPTREEILELANAVAACGATRVAGVLRRGVELEAEIERLREKCDELGSDKERWYRMAELHCSTIVQLKADNERLQNENSDLKREIKLYLS